MQTTATAQQTNSVRGYSRDELMIMATERFCDRESHDRLTVDQYKQAFYQLIGDIDAKTKREISRLLATCDYTPRAIAIYCALEALNIARPMLQNSNVLGQVDLNQIIDMRGVSHGLIIAGRMDLQETAVNKLRELNDPNINAALLYNPALGSMRSLLEEDRAEKQTSTTSIASQIDTSFMQHDQRVDTSTNLKQNATSAPSINFESYLRDESIASAKIQPQPSAPVSFENDQQTQDVSPLQEKLLTAAARGGRIAASTVATNIQTQNTSLSAHDFGQAMENAAQAKSRQGMAVLMQKQSGITLDTAYRLLEDKSGDTLSVLMKASGVTPPQANRILLLTQPSIGLSVQNAMRAVRFYNDLKQETCKTAVAQWPKETTGAPQLDSQLQEGRNVRGDNATQVVQPSIRQDRFERYAS